MKQECVGMRSEIRLGVKLDSESQIELTVMGVKAWKESEKNIKNTSI